MSPEPPNWPAEDWHEVKGGQFSRVVLRQVDATGTFAVNADFTNADLRNSVFDFADLRGANFLGAKLDGVSFYGADLREAFFPDVAPAEMDLGQANVQGAHFGKLGPKTLKPAHNWILADISDPARFSLPSDHGERLSRRDFSGYDLNQLLTNGPARYLKNGGENVLVLPDVDNLSAADLSGANLQQVNLEDIALRKTNLLGADLRGANVKGCDFYQAILHDADLRGLDMTGVHGLTLAQIQSAKTDKKTRLPDYLQRQLAFGQTKSPNEAVSGSDNRSGGGATREQPR